MRPTVMLMLFCSMATTTMCQWGGRVLFQAATYLTEAVPVLTLPDNRPKPIRLALGIGVDHDPTSRTSIGLEFNYDLKSFSNYGGSVQVDINGIPTEADVRDRSYSVLYRSMFTTGHNEGMHLYFGPVVGIRRFSRVYDTANSSGGRQGRYVASTLLFPIELRVGFRGSGLRIAYFDMYGGVGSQLGRGSPLNGDVRETTPHVNMFSSFIWHAGIAYGFGTE